MLPKHSPLEIARLFGRAPLDHPQYIIFFVTSKCAGRCKHCFYWEDINRDEKPLSVPEVEKISASMGPLLQVTFTGGEPFLRPDFEDIVKVMHERNGVFHLGVATSGYMPARVEKGVSRILKDCPGANLTIGLPIEGPAELNNEIRGRDNFYERTTETLARLKKLGQRQGRLTLLVDITASGFNRGRLRETYEHVRDDLRPDHVNVILTRGAPREGGALELDPAEVDGLLGMMEDDARRGRVSGYAFFSRLLHAKDVVLRRAALDIYKSGAYRFPCEAGRVAGVIMPEGGVYPCELWEGPVGNLREAAYDMRAVWNSDKARETRREIVGTGCACYHQCFLSNTIFFNARAWPSILRERARMTVR